MIKIYSAHNGSSTSAELHVSIAKSVWSGRIKTGFIKTIQGSQDLGSGRHGEYVVNHIEGSIPAIITLGTAGEESDGDTLSYTDCILDIDVLHRMHRCKLRFVTYRRKKLTAPVLALLLPWGFDPPSIVSSAKVVPEFRSGRSAPKKLVRSACWAQLLSNPATKSLLDDWVADVVGIP